MARTSQRSIPLLLVGIAVTLVGLRVGVRFLEPDQKTGSGVHWVSPEEGLRLAASSGKSILFDFTAEWCQPCHQLDAAVFMVPELAAQINDRFIPVRVMDRQQEDGRNSSAVAALQQRYSIRGFPTVVFADASGAERARIEGFRGRPDFERVMAGAR
jgi:thiol:disulfide interchange protein